MLAICLAGGCNQQPGDAKLQDMFDKAEQLCLDRHYEDAKNLLRSYLLYKPEHPGAHYYLGRTYMLSEDFRPLLAEGEYQTALHLFLHQGRVSGIKRFDANYFELMCNLDSAKVIAIYADAMIRAHAPADAVHESLARALEYVARAEKVNPKAGELNAVGDPIRQMAVEFGVSPR